MNHRMGDIGTATSVSDDMRVLVWQWGRRGAGPRFGVSLHAALRDRPGVTPILSLSRSAEILGGPDPVACDIPVRTYSGLASYVVRLVGAPLSLPALISRLRRLKPEVAICAMPGPLDLLMAASLRVIGCHIIVIVHEAELHPGDGFWLQMALQRLLCRFADGVAALSRTVELQLRDQHLIQAERLLVNFSHPPFDYQSVAGPREPGIPRLLFFGRLLPYKGLDLLAQAIGLLPAGQPISIRIVGHGPESVHLGRLRSYPNVVVENRWASEEEIGSLLGWADAVILPYREATQSGVAAAAIGAGLPIIATCVGGLREQLTGVRLSWMCEPEPGSLALAIRDWLQSPFERRTVVSPAIAWREATSALLAEISSLVARRASRERSSQLPIKGTMKPAPP
jgi:glycosyltransferase involved in cell wall biosynthesis